MERPYSDTKTPMLVASMTASCSSLRGKLETTGRNKYCTHSVPHRFALTVGLRILVWFLTKQEISMERQLAVVRDLVWFLRLRLALLAACGMRYRSTHLTAHQPMEVTPFVISLSTRLETYTERHRKEVQDMEWSSR